MTFSKLWGFLRYIGNVYTCSKFSLSETVPGEMTLCKKLKLNFIDGTYFLEQANTKLQHNSEMQYHNGNFKILKCSLNRAFPHIM